MKGQVAIIAGAAGGIGLSTAKAFAEAGAKIGMADINELVGTSVETKSCWI
jgi:NAD(P)-dependent dehydrogenase (short-subunit alcohol dehydrogenase family)